MTRLLMGFVFLFLVPAFGASATPTIIDVRTSEEFADGHAKNAINIDVTATDFEKKISKLDKSKPYAVHCASGRRSGKAVATMKKMGFTNIEDLKTAEAAIEKYGKQ